MLNKLMLGKLYLQYEFGTYKINKIITRDNEFLQTKLDGKVIKIVELNLKESKHLTRLYEAICNNCNDVVSFSPSATMFSCSDGKDYLVIFNHDDNPVSIELLNIKRG